MRKYFVLIILIMAIPMTMRGQYDYENDGIYYRKGSGINVYVTSGPEKYAGDVTIPAYFSYGGTTLYVAGINKKAFEDCIDLTSITLPDYYRFSSIGENAFSGCTGLTSIHIPKDVTSIGGGVFAGCTNLTSITVDRDNDKYDSRENCLGIIERSTNTLISGFENTVIPTSVTSIEYTTFSGCTGLTTIDIPTSVTSIGNGAFIGCTGLTFIDIPTSVTSIGSNAFYGCTSLTSIDIPSSVTSIGSNAFYGCTGLTSITVDSENTVYDSRGNCNAIIETSSNTLIVGCQNTTIPTSVTSIGSGAFSGCTGLTTIDIPTSVTSIGSGAFSDCTGLTTIDIPTSVTSIESNTFYGCTGLTSVSIGDGVTSIEFNTFSGCTGLTSFNIPTNVTSIGNNAFYGCTGLTSIDIPTSVTSIGNSAFSDCSGLTSVSIGDGVTSIGYSAFSNCNLTSVSIGDGVTSIGNNAFANNRNLEIVTCNAISVPTTSNPHAFNNSNYNNAILIVPDEAFDAYSTTWPWSSFGTILKKSEVAVTANSYTREYGDANPTFEYTIGSSLTGTPVISCEATETSAPGTYPISISQGTVTGDNMIFVNGTLTITPAPLTITANSYTITEGDALPTFEAEFSGLKNDETSEVVNPVFSCDATDGNTPGTYDIVVTATSDNYDITIENGTLTILRAPMEITISSVGVATYCSPYDLDFSNVTGFKAYIATGYNKYTGNVIVQHVTDAPAGTGLFLKGTPGTYQVPCGESGSYFVNMLVGSTEATTIYATDGNMTNFVLYATNTSDACFRPISSTYNLKANRAYLQIPTSMVSTSAGANGVGIEFEEGVTGIDNSLSDMDTDAHWFTLDGRKLNGKPTQKGIYVVNGQKVVIK